MILIANRGRTHDFHSEQGARGLIFEHELFESDVL